MSNPTPPHPHIPQSVRDCHCQASLQTICVSWVNHTHLHLVVVVSVGHDSIPVFCPSQRWHLSLQHRLSTTNISKADNAMPATIQSALWEVWLQISPHETHGACLCTRWQAGEQARGKSNFGSYNPPTPPQFKSETPFQHNCPVLSNKDMSDIIGDLSDS